MQETEKKKSVQFNEQFTAGNPMRPVLVNCEFFLKAASILYKKIIKYLQEQSVSENKTRLPLLMTFFFKMN